jgi:tRNA (guanine-N7-)-methyltransferase
VGKKKLKRFAEIGSFANVIQPNDRYPVEDHPYKGRWNEAFFKNDHPIVFEMGCGKGEYTLALARKYPEVNFIGIDIKGERIWKGANQALQEGITNAAFLRIQAERINYFFGPDEISGIWITFPDPQPRQSRQKKRLTSPRFLDRYAGILKPGSPIHLKTDSRELFEYTLEVVHELGHTLHYHTADLYEKGNVDEPLIKAIQTHYESIFRAEGIPIKYLRFSLKTPPDNG